MYNCMIRSVYGRCTNHCSPCFITMYIQAHLIMQSYIRTCIPIGVSTDAVPREDSEDFFRQLQRDALWSDPSPSPGLHLNPRGIYNT